MNSSQPGRPGIASLALLLILVVTAAWWALALWPTGAAEPEWLARTRGACFGSAPGGLPDAGGWILLIGQPIGMIAVLFAVWGSRLREDLQRIRVDRGWRRFALVVVATLVTGVVAAGVRVAFATGIATPAPAPPTGILVTLELDVSSVVLVDQHGRRASLGNQAGRPALLTFAFGHCVTVCPTIVRDVQAARRTAGRHDVPLLVISLDPWRDTPLQLPAIAAQWGLGPEDRVLSGSVAEVERALDLLQVGRTRNLTTGDIDHVATVMILNDRAQVVRRLDGGWGRTGALLASLPEPDLPIVLRVP